VKGDSYSWSDKGVGISKTQYDEASKCRGSFCLAVVDNLKIAPSNPHYILDPVSCITEYRFDSGWLELSTDIKILDELSTATVSERLIELTDSMACKSIIQFCEEEGFPLPEVGLEIVGARGQVVLENVELAWENEKLGVFIEPEEKTVAEKQVMTWQFFDCNDLESLKASLEDAFQFKDV